MQLKLDFSRVTAAALSDVAQAKGTDLSSLVMEYVVNGYLEDLKEILLIQAKGNVTVRDLLKKD